MPLFNLDGKRMTALPLNRQVQFNEWRRRLTDNDYQRVLDGIRSRCDGKEFVVSSFIPGSGWANSEFGPLEAACRLSYEQSGKFFGLIVWQFMIDDADHEWRFIEPGEGEDVQGMRYFIPGKG